MKEGIKSVKEQFPHKVTTPPTFPAVPLYILVIKYAAIVPK
jgi:hypothetical protein